MTEKVSLKIGLVIPSFDNYSETFFRSKIDGLISNGFKVYLFPINYYSKILKPNDNLIIKRQNRISKYSLLNYINVIYNFIYSNIFNPFITYKYWTLMRGNGNNFSEFIKSLYINSHILFNPVDILHFGFATMGIGREFIANSINSKCSTSLRGYDISIYPLKNKGCYDLLWKFIDRIHTISDDLIVQASINCNLPKHIPHKKIFPAIMVDKFPYSKLKRFGDEITFTSVARLHWKKGLEYTIHALSILKKRGVRFKYNIIGSGDDYERLAFLISELGLQNDVSFKGILTHKEIYENLIKTDIYLQYSIQEGFCNSVLEAQASGCLCVVSDAEGLNENILHNKTGWIVSKRNPKKLAEKIIDVLKMDYNFLLTISKNASERVHTKFNIEKQHQEFKLFFEQI